MHETSGAPDLAAQLDAAEESCARQGGTLTALRRSVLALILDAGRPLTAYQLLDRLREERPGAAPPTIYRALDFLLEHRLIHRISRLNAFIPCQEADGAHGGHAHRVQFLICRHCGSVTEIEDAAVLAALAAAARRQGFAPGEAVIELEGVCAACRAAEATP